MGRFTSISRFVAMMTLCLAADIALASQQFTVNGTIDYLQNVTTGVTTQDGTFQAVVNYDSSVPENSISSFFGSSTHWSQSVTSISYHVYDGAGNLIYSGDVSPSSDSSATFYSDTTTSQSSMGQMVEWTANLQGSTTSDEARVTFSDPSNELFSDMTQYPDPTQMMVGTGKFWFNSVGTDYDFTGFGTVTGITVGAVDSDGDGIADNVDSCPHSNLSPTVTVNGVDSGVKNTLEPDGCTLMDILGSSSSPDQVAHATNQMRRDGLINGRSKGQIESAAGRGN